MEKCNSCEWFCEEDTSGFFSHPYAKEKQEGFCIMKDLFTSARPDDEACKQYFSDDHKIKGD